jgi:hypothetical protein
MSHNTCSFHIRLAGRERERGLNTAVSHRSIPGLPRSNPKRLRARVIFFANDSRSTLPVPCDCFCEFVIGYVRTEQEW